MPSTMYTSSELLGSAFSGCDDCDTCATTRQHSIQETRQRHAWTLSATATAHLFGLDVFERLQVEVPLDHTGAHPQARELRLRALFALAAVRAPEAIVRQNRLPR